MNCWGDFPVLFTYGGDSIERCATCHNEARDFYMPGGILDPRRSTWRSEPDWF
jgi:hypothetical protein